jgi:hypothetical protein
MRSEVSLDTDPAQKLRMFIFDFGRNILPQTLLNQYITGSPEGQ